MSFIYPYCLFPQRQTFIAQSDRAPGTESLGVNVHFLTPQSHRWLVGPQDLDMIQAAGFKKVRLDLLWSEVEQHRGKYQFEKYDWIIQNLLQRGIQPVVILGLGNPLYAKELTIRPPATQKAFENYAMAAVNHFKGKGLAWELINEPNHAFFWKPKPDVDEYMRLAQNVLPTLKAIDPSGFFVAPSTAGVPIAFLEKCFQKGLLQWVDGVTIHPYQAFYKAPPINRCPESFEAEYQAAKQLIQRYAPPGKQIPLLLGEWGYSSATGEVSEAEQANFLMRQALLGMMHGSPLNIWYDWKGDINGNEGEQNKEEQFGIMHQSMQPKQGYYAMQQLAVALTGQSFQNRLPSHSQDYLLMFGNPFQKTLVAWTSGPAHFTSLNGISIPLSGRPLFQRLT